LFLDVLKPRLDFGSSVVGEGLGEGDGCRHDRRLGGWMRMDGWMDECDKVNRNC
jgi:hypothetical protein